MPQSQRQAVGDFLFWVQIVAGFFFGGSQFLRLLKTTQGVNPSWYVTWLVFLVLLWSVTHDAYQHKKSRLLLQSILGYSMWMILVMMDLGAMMWNGGIVWSELDHLTFSLTFVGGVLTIIIATFRNLTINNPMVRGWLAVFFKAIPQFTLAANLWMMGRGGLSGVAILMGHITIVARCTQHVLAMFEAPKETIRKAPLLAEIFNELSWIAVTVVWFVR